MSNAQEVIANPFFNDTDFDTMRDITKSQTLAPSKPILECDEDTYYFGTNLK